MAEVKWVKLTTDMFDNRKIKHLRRLPEGNNIVLIWVMLLTMAGRCNSGGMIFLTENIPYTPKMLADELDFEENTVILALQVLEQLDMIVTDNGFFAIAGWEEYQSADKLAEIRAKDRERKRLKKAQASVALSEASVSTEIPRNIHGNSTDIPHIEEEKEIEKEKEKEFHSFIHLREEEEYVKKKIAYEGLEGDDKYKEQLKSNLKCKYIEGSLGKGVVFMSDEQFEDLCDKLSIDEMDKYFGIVADKELKGHHYKKKTHYQAILEMACKDRKLASV